MMMCNCNYFDCEYVRVNTLYDLCMMMMKM